MFASLRRYLEMYSSPLTRKVVMGVFLGIIVIEAIILVPSYDKRKNDLFQDIQNRITLIANTLMQLEQLPLAERIRQLEALPDVSGIQTELITQTPPSTSFKYHPHEKQLEIPYTHPALQPTMLRITTDASNVSNELSQYVLRIIGLILVISAFVTAVTIFIVGHLLIEPLIRLNKKLSQSTVGSELLPVSHQLLIRQDEIGDLSRSYEQLSGKIAEAFAEIKAQARFPFENPNPILRCDFDGKVIYRNPTAESEYLFRIDDSNKFTAQQLNELLHQSLNCEQGKTLILEEQDKIFSVTMVPFPKHGYLNIYARNITEQIQAERELTAIKNQLEEQVVERTQELTRKQQQLVATITSSLDAIVVMDHRGHIVEFNPAAETIFSFQRSEVIGKRLSDYLIPADLREMHEQGMQNYLRTGRSNLIGQRIETRAQRKDGQEFPIEIAVEIAREGEQALFVSFMRDITQRIEQQQALTKAKEDAEQANRAKSSFLANMSHEIRTPMNAILGLSHLSLETDLSTEQRNYASKIQSAARTLLNIINDVLDFSKIEAGHLVIEQVAFDLDQLLEEVHTVNHLKARDKQINFTIHRSPSLPQQLIGDPIRLQQILVNLVGNAIKFTHQGSVILDIQASDISDTSMQLQISVVDTGIGIAKEHQRTLFNIFTQGDVSTTRKYGGTGLGLAITKQLTELIGGEITFSSKINQGTEFKVTLPVKIPEQSTPLYQHHLRDKTLLVVGEENLVTESLQAFSINYIQHPMDQLTIDAIKSSLEQQQADALLLVADATSLLVHAERLNTELPCPAIAFLSDATPSIPSMSDTHGTLQVIDMPCTPSSLLDTLFNTLCPTQYNQNDTCENGKQPIHHLQDSRVLLVEDNAINTEVALSMLEEIGVNVTCAENGAVALEKLAQEKFDLVLMDLQMPVMDGFTAVKEIRNNKALHNLPVIALTAHAMTGDKQRSLAAGMDDHITKPIDPDALYDTLIKWLPTSTESGFLTEKDASVKPLPQDIELAGLDITSALHRLSNNYELYLSLLNKFQTEYSNTVSEMHQHVEQQETAELQQLSHRLKGIAANLGATEIEAIASQLQNAHTANSQTTSILLSKLEAAFTEFNAHLPSVAEMLSTPTEDIKEGESSLQALPLIEELEKLLNNGDIEALSALQKLKPLLNSNAESEQFTAAESSLDAFEFDQAIEHLQQLKTLLH